MVRITVAALMLAGILLGQERRPLPTFDRRTPIVLAVENVGPAVVNISNQGEVTRRRGFTWFQDFEETDREGGPAYAERSLGSGVIVHPDGFVITNDHVVRDADRILVKTQAGDVVKAQLISTNTDSDVAVLKLEAGRKYPYVELGDSDQLYVGEVTMALGNPFGLSNSVTDGILSAKGRSVRFRGREVFSDFLQTSAMINPGNSGGPLLDVNGRVIGINVAIDNRGPGIGYAIPINRVKEVMTRLLQPELTKQAWLGLEPVMENGRLVAAHVAADGPAAQAGLSQGDEIMAVGPQLVDTPFEFYAALQSHEPGRAVPLHIRQPSGVRRLSVKFAPLPLESLVGDHVERLGMTCANLTPAAASRLRLPSNLLGPVVLDVAAGSSAEAIGIQKGDVILQVDVYNVPRVAELARAVDWFRRRSRTVTVKVYRESEGLLQGILAF